MNTPTRTPALRATLATLCALLALSALAQPVNIETDTVVVSTTRLPTAAATPINYQVADGAVLTFFSPSSTTAGYTVNLGSFTIGPSGTLGTGWTIISDFSGTQTNGTNVQGGFITSATTVTITNATFLNNFATGNGGIIRMTAGPVTLTNVILEGNFAYAAGGAIQNAGGVFTLTNASVSNNRTANTGGALNSSSGSMAITDVTFTDNWAGAQGGAINAGANAPVTLTLTGSRGTDYRYTGNFAGGAAVTDYSTLKSGVPAFNPVASAGGFYYGGTNSSIVFNIATGVSLTIGDANAANRAYDSIASLDATARITKSGGGSMILNADNSYYRGALAIDGGKVILGNPRATLGASVTVNSGATFGGAGVLSRNGGTTATTLTANASSTIQLGADGALSAQTLAANGLVDMKSGATLATDLFASNKSHLLDISTGTFNWAGTGTINLGALSTGVFTLAQWDSSNLADATSLTLLADGALIDASRGSASLTIDTTAKQLLVTAAITSLSGTWNNSATTWRAGAAGWTTPATDTHFQNGDSVTFNTGGAITVAGSVIASQMNVAIVDSLTFTGDGAITTDAASVQPSSDVPNSGTLIKTGTGILTLANTATNTFKSGVQLKEGTIAFASASQFDLAGTSVTLDGTATLAALDGATGTIRGNIVLDDATTTATYDAGASSAITLNGALRGAAGGAGTFTKSGAGTLTLIGNSTAFTGATRVTAGSLLLAPGASLGGAVTAIGGAIGGAGTLSGITTIAPGGALQVGNPALANALNLSVTNLQLEPGASLNFQILPGGASSHLTAGTLTFNSGATGADMFITLSDIINGTYNLATFGSYNPAALQGFANADVRLTDRELNSREKEGTTVITSGGALSLHVDLPNQRIFWTGTSGTGWTSGDNWKNATIDLSYVNGDTVVFDGSDTAGQRDVVIEGAQVTLSGMEVIGTGDYRITGGAIVTDAASTTNIEGTGQLLLNTTGTLTLANTGTNNFRQGVKLVKGTIVVDSDGAFSRSNTLTVAGAATLSFAGMTTGTDLRITYVPIDIENGSVLTIDTPIAAAAFGNMTSAGNGSVVKTGADTLSVARVDVSTLIIEQGALYFQPSIPLVTREAIDIRPEGRLFGRGGTIRTPQLINQGTLRVGRGADTSFAIGSIILDGNYHGDGGRIMISATTTPVVSGTVTKQSLVTDQLIVTGTLSGSIYVEIFGAKPQKIDDWSWQPIILTETGAIAPDMTIDKRSMMWDMASPYVYCLVVESGTFTYKKYIGAELPPVVAVDAASLLIGKASLDSLHNRLAVTRLDDIPEKQFNAWVSYLHRGDKLSTAVHDGADAKTNGAQAGFDWAVDSNGHRFTFGVFYDYARNEMDSNQPAGAIDLAIANDIIIAPPPALAGKTNATTTANGCGFYLGYKTGRFYIDTIGRISGEQYKITTPAGAFDTNGYSWAASLGTGYVFSGLAAWDIEPQLRLTYQTHNIDNATDPLGRVYEINSADSCEALAAVRVSQRYEWLNGLALVPYARAGLTHEFKGKTRVSVLGQTGRPFENDLSGIGSVLEAGVVVQFGRGLYAAASGAWRKASNLESYSLDATVGLRW